MKSALFAALALAACGSSTATPDAANPDARPRTVYGGDRPTELQLPANYSPDKKYPLIMVLHGYGVNGSIETAVLELGDVATNPGAFFLAPDGTLDSHNARFWNASPVCCNMDNLPVDDVAYLGGLIDDVSRDWPIDPARVYIAGHSNGAFMAYRMACDRADVVTAIAGLAGSTTSIDGSGCNPVKPVSVLHLHGTADSVIPYDGSTLEAGAVDSVGQWAVHDGCASTFTTGTPMDLDQRQAGAETTVMTADGCPTGVDVTLWSITGADHVPSFVPTFGATLTDWFMAHPRP